MRSNDLRWNFEKFLIDSSGHPVKRFASSVTPSDLISHIDQLMIIDRHNRMNLRDDFLDENSF